MDGMYYRGEGNEQTETAAPPRSDWRLVALTAAGAVAVLAAVVLLSMAGANFTMPDEVAALTSG